MAFCTSLCDLFQPPEVEITETVGTTGKREITETVGTTEKRDIPWDIISNDSNYVIIAELPGAQYVSLNVVMDSLVVSCTGYGVPVKSQFLVQERIDKPSHRTFTLPPDSIPEKIYSEFNNGLLIVRIPRKPILNVPVVNAGPHGLKWE